MLLLLPLLELLHSEHLDPVLPRLLGIEPACNSRPLLPDHLTPSIALHTDCLRLLQGFIANNLQVLRLHRPLHRPHHIGPVLKRGAGLLVAQVHLGPLLGRGDVLLVTRVEQGVGHHPAHGILVHGCFLLLWVKNMGKLYHACYFYLTLLLSY